MIIPDIFEKKVWEYPLLVPTNTNLTNLLTLWYKERESTMVYINEVSQNLVEKGHLQILVENFVGQSTCWLGTHHLDSKPRQYI